MDLVALNAKTDLEVGDSIVLQNGDIDKIERARFIQEISGPKGSRKIRGWFEFHLYVTNKWVDRNQIRGRLKGVKL